MFNQILNLKQLSSDIEKYNKQVAKNLSNDKFKNITDDEWNILIEHKGTAIWEVLQKIQDEIYSHYVVQLLSKLQEATQHTIKVDASIYGGLLEGIYESNIRTLFQEGRKRKENRERKNSGNKT